MIGWLIDEEQVSGSEQEHGNFGAGALAA